MRIAIVGYGKMGKEIELQAKQLHIPISQIINQEKDLSLATFQPDEVAIEFTSPESCLKNFYTLIQKKVPVITGTTGWLQHEKEIRSLVTSHDGAFLYASNFSIGVHLFWKTLETLSKSMNTFPQYNVSVLETHHTQKKDKPSGTGKTCAEIIENNIQRIKNIEIESIRTGNVVGDHRILFDSLDDVIELSHKAKSRTGFAKGAITCAAWLHGKQGFFSIEDYLSEAMQ